LAKKSDIVEKIAKCSKDVVAQPGFLPVDYTELENYCKEFLLESGYRVVKPLKARFKAKREDDLFHLFYDRLKYYHPDLSVYSNLKRDRAIASRFVKARMELGDISKEYALNECAEIILTVFEHENDFNFNLPLTFEMFGQANCAWITEKAIGIINKKKEKREALIIDKMIEEYNNEYLKKHGIESIALLSKIEEAEDGKKEEG